MKTILQTLTALSLAFLVSCTSNEKAFKNAAEEAAKAQFATTVEEEARGYLTQSDNFKNAYVSYMVKFAEFSAEEVRMSSESSGVTTVFITSYAPDVRKKLLRVASTVKSSVTGQFNFSNAVQLIAKETGLPGDPMKYPFVTLNLKKDAKGDWIVLK
ncbi:hypothetical protein [Bdellovibrio sp. KM01]|uniref:hypothetical protein n=1 Tax=Bdellovibrio sp. KM01 TaxID=2748865 RepID=UPI0015EA2607|nr:hypothetical protein [Bdellovibrio sp. KM01]QLY24578.1 hypothetical protein HW988_14105 [Bdellovibrio sp. KM01]